MGTISRSDKGGGNTDIQDGTTGTASQINTDMNTLFNEINGNLDEDNISASAQIPNSSLAEVAVTKVGDHSSNVATFNTTKNPGGGLNPTLPVDLSDELESIRYRIQNNNHMRVVQGWDQSAAAMANVSWSEPPIMGPNLIPNPGFEGPVTANVPAGWGTISGAAADTVAVNATAAVTMGASKRHLRITNSTDTSARGIEVTIPDLKAATKYVVGVAFSVSNPSDVATLSVDANLGTGTDYGDATATTGTVSIAVKNVIIQTTATPDDVTIQLTASARVGAIAHFYYVWMHELQEQGNLEIPHIPMQTATYTTANDAQTDAAGGTWFNLSDLTLSQYIPCHGYRLIYEVNLTWGSSGIPGASNYARFAFRIQADSGGGAATVQGPYGYEGRSTDTTDEHSGITSMKYVIENPTPGSTYTLTADVFVDNTSAITTMYMNPSVDALATQSDARLYFERL